MLSLYSLSCKTKKEKKPDRRLRCGLQVADQNFRVSQGHTETGSVHKNWKWVKIQSRSQVLFPTRPYGARETGRREPWERGWPK